ncbi:MAG: DUF4440 domain-containing protein [Dehalococcoidia bacterium]|nr:DUF4440 domain-containing protein [Dehalococcoidia bacterium]
MSVEENIANVRRLNDEVWNRGNLALVDELMAPDYVFHGENEIKGPEGIKQYIAAMRTAFPDLHMTIEGMVAEGDMVAARYTARGTFKGEFMGIAPTGKQMTLPNSAFARFKGGKQVEVWPYMDSLTFYKQMGVTPPMGQA